MELQSHKIRSSCIQVLILDYLKSICQKKNTDLQLLVRFIPLLLEIRELTSTPKQTNKQKQINGNNFHPLKEHKH
jgi:hypothetical protein